MDQKTKDFILSHQNINPQHIDPSVVQRVLALIDLSGPEARAKFDEIISDCVLRKTASDHLIPQMVQAVRFKGLWQDDPAPVAPTPVPTAEPSKNA